MSPSSDRLVGFEELHRFSANRLPNLQGLERETPAEDGNCDDVTRARVGDVLGPIRETCIALGWQPLILELAIISDPRLAVDPDLKGDRHFMSYIWVSLPNAKEVADTYRRALAAMKSQEQTGTQIVPHLELYSVNTGLVKIRLAEVLSGTANQEEELIDAGGGDADGGTWDDEITIHPRQEFSLREGGASVVDQTTLFAKTFLEGIETNPGLASARRCLATSTLVILPFVRPHIQVGNGASTKHQELRGAPGGAVFLFLSPARRTELTSSEGTAPHDINEVGRTVASMLAEASLRESYAILDIEIERRHVFGDLLRVFGHGVANYMKAAGLVSLMSRARGSSLISSAEVVSSLEMVWPVWSIGDLARIAAMEKGDLRLEWLDKSLWNDLEDDYLRSRPDPQKVVPQIQSIVLSQFAARCALRRDMTGSTIGLTWNGNPVSSEEFRSARPREVWPFVSFEVDDCLPGTALVTMGLVELLANAINYLLESGLKAEQRLLDVAANVDDEGALVVRLCQALSVGHWQDAKGGGRGLESQTIEAVRQTLETRLTSPRGPIVSTSPFAVEQEEPKQVATWRFVPANIRWRQIRR